MGENVIGADNQQERLQKLDAKYVVGLVDGEGYFSVAVGEDKSKSYKSLRVRLVFGVKLKEFDGRILYRLKETLGCGKIRRRIDTRPNFSNCFEYQVRDFSDIKAKIIPFFEKHNLQFKSKKLAFERFSEMAKLFDKKVHLTENGFEKMRYLARNLHAESSETIRQTPIKTG